ncbi:MAG: DUF3152 domain-containing protein [Jatrophihabitantaceae bacterium]
MVDDGGWSRATHSVAAPDRIDRSADVRTARHAVATFGGGRGPGPGDAVREFVRRYGWRAYALPVLVTVTVLALFTARSPSTSRKGDVANPGAAADRSAASAPPVAPNDLPLKSDAGSTGASTNALTVGQLPPGAPYSTEGTGRFRTVKGTTKVFGRTGRLFHYDIQAETGITGVDLTAFATLVDRTLADPRSWSGHGVRLQRVSSGAVDFHVSLTSVMTVRKYCGYDIPVETSCYAKAGTAGLTVNRVVLNDARWVRGASPYIADLASYHVYMINHEDGHALGHNHAHQCLPGGLAPAMMQQTFGLKSAISGKNCGANPWPYPTGVSGAPGVEGTDTKKNNEYYIGD